MTLSRVFVVEPCDRVVSKEVVVGSVLSGDEVLESLFLGDDAVESLFLGDERGLPSVVVDCVPGEDLLVLEGLCDFCCEPHLLKNADMPPLVLDPPDKGVFFGS